MFRSQDYPYYLFIYLFICGIFKYAVSSQNISIQRRTMG